MRNGDDVAVVSLLFRLLLKTAVPGGSGGRLGHRGGACGIRQPRSPRWWREYRGNEGWGSLGLRMIINEHPGLTLN
jgi:hypothetical protein